ncbi:hypothetical protein BDW59DRAFT_133370 [Aspergillus cavernicola]|uniref:Glycoprotease family protein n=1 Tax=Aspergillus cavernicola TaxID=176166 RepID=A0ABR4HPP3_9EURO
MPSSSDKQRAQLTIPQVPKFPLSSPITEEIASPTSSSSEEREMERNRPFEFLAKVSSKNPFAHKEAASDRIREFEQGVSATTEGQGGSGSSYTARKNPDRPVGLNLDIPMSTSNARKDTAAAFVDLNDLKVLSKAREEERTAQKIKGILKKGDTRGFQRLPDEPLDERGGRKRASLLYPGPKSPKRKARDDGISPTDRPIVIGYSVPFDSPELQDEISKELDSAGTQPTPLTPSIIVTPAKEDSFWRHLSPEKSRPRAASSVYSQPSPYLGTDLANAPPVPALPALYSTGNEEGKSSDPQPVGSVRKRRSFSTGAVDEKDEYQPEGRPRSHSNEKTGLSGRLTINTSMNARASQGWWNYILSPLLSRTSTLLSRATPTETRPPVPTIATSSTDLSDEWWEEKERWNEKETSYFSPDTPDATSARKRISDWQTMHGNPFADFDWSIDEQSRSPEGRRVASTMLSGQSIEGAGAEYFQACAHELFSKTPYFECTNHVCSITPKHMISVVEASAPLQNTQSDRNLLIDVDDMPRSRDLESPKSGITSINSSPSDEASILSREMRTSVKTSRAAPSERISGSPEPNPEIPDFRTRQLDSSPEIQDTNQSTNPFLQQSRDIPAPTNYHFQQPAPQPPANIHIENAAAPPPANIHIQAPAAHPAPNIYFQAPMPPTAPAAPEFADAPAAPAPMAREAPAAFVAPTPEAHFQEVHFPEAPAPVASAPVASPPVAPPPVARAAPLAMPSPDRMPPPHYGAQPPSPYPRSPESLQEATGRGGSIRLSNMPAGPAPAYTPHDSSSLPPRVRATPISSEPFVHPVTERDGIETRLRQLEREDEVGKKSGGWWRARGLFSKKGRVGKKKREGKIKRRWYLVICLFLIAIVVAAILLAIFLTRKGDGTPVQSQWLNLTGYPPMPTGISTIAGPEAQTQESGCINPASLWSCALPKEQQPANDPYAGNQPNFRVEIRFQNGTYDRSTALASRSLQMASRSTNQLFNPSPSPPTTDEQTFLGRTTDDNSKPYGGEESPFYITVLSAEHLSSSQLKRRDTNTTDSFPDLESIIPSPATDSDGSAAAAVLYPFPSSQPVRLYNRGEENEHYGFYTYFDRSIFLSSSTPITGRKDNAANDTDGGSTKADARVRCTWSQTRFHVQIWTNAEESGKVIFDRTGNSTTTDTASATETATSPTSASSATDFTRPGSFPYPITITLDRHGGSTGNKMVYCYGMESDQHVNKTEVKLQLEDRGYNGALVNPAPGIFNLTGSSNSTESEGEDEDFGGYDGGSGGCSCQWVNWVGTD